MSLAVENETFSAKGTTTISPGWKAVIAQEKNEKEEEIPLLQEGQQLTLKDVKLQQEKRKLLRPLQRELLLLQWRIFIMQ